MRRQIGQIPNLEKLMATIRSREISAALVLQAKSQLKAIYKDNADTIIGNCDSQIFLGGSEQTTLKDLNATLGKCHTNKCIRAITLMNMTEGDIIARADKNGKVFI